MMKNTGYNAREPRFHFQDLPHSSSQLSVPLVLGASSTLFWPPLALHLGGMHTFM